MLFITPVGLSVYVLRVARNSHEHRRQHLDDSQPSRKIPATRAACVCEAADASDPSIYVIIVSSRLRNTRRQRGALT